MHSVLIVQEYDALVEHQWCRKCNTYHPSMEWLLEADEGTVFELDKTTLINPHATISAKHCSITRRDKQLLITDRNSTNGTFVVNLNVSSASGLLPMPRLAIYQPTPVRAGCGLQLAADPRLFTIERRVGCRTEGSTAAGVLFFCQTKRPSKHNG